MRSGFQPVADPRPSAMAFQRRAGGWPIPAELRLTGQWVELAVSDPLRDADELFAVLDDSMVWSHVVGKPASADQMADLITSKLDDPGWCPFTVRLLQPIGEYDVGAVVGTTSYLEVVAPQSRGEIGSTTYAPAVWATAVNPECKLLLLRCAFETLGWARVQFKTDVRNQRSQAAIAKLGATYEGLLRQYQPRPDGSQRDSALFSITVDDWPGVRASLDARISSFGRGR